jgi:arylsulfatase A-like enzyme
LAPALSALALLALAACSRGSGFRTVVLVTIDTLRADHVGAYGYPRPTTPFLDSLAAGGVLFEAAYASSSHTAPSHATMFTGLYPEEHGVLQNGARLAEGQFTTLAEVMSQAGFRTGAFSAVGFLKQISQGFQHIDTWRSPPGSKRTRWAEETVSAALDWVGDRAARERVFLWVHLFDVHEHDLREGPHTELLHRVTQLDQEDGTAFAEYLRRVYPGGRVKRRQRVDLDYYDAQLAYVDRHIGRLYDRIADLREGPSLWVITSDHGEGLGNHGLRGHGRHLYNEQLRVPFIVHSSVPAWPPGRVGRLVRLVDLLPTIGVLAGASSHERRIEGVSLVPLLESPDASVPIDLVFAQRRPSEERPWLSELVLAAQGGRYKYIYHSERGDELYDLEADPRELINRVSDHRVEAARLKRWLLERYERMRQSRAGSSDEIAPEHLEELRSLGYID